MILVRDAGPEHFDAIAALQARNLATHLMPEQRVDGFLSAAFSHAQLLHMSTDLGIDVAFDGACLAGYLCAFRCADQPRPPVIEAMLAAFAQCRFDGQPLDPAQCYIYGPVCIEREYRGGTLLRKLFDAQRHRLADRYAVGAAFIADANPRSFDAHTRKLGMVRVGSFRQGDADFHIVAFHTRTPGEPHGK